MSAANLLVEIGCEELPAGQLDSQLKLLGDGLVARLLDAGLIDAAPAIERFATPRRLAVLVANVRARQADQLIERTGPNEKVALDGDGRPSKAGEGFARSVGKSFDELEWVDSDQGRRLFCRVEQAGMSLEALLPEMFASCIAAMAGARSMRWSNREERFLRPVRWLLAIHGEDALALDHFGLNADRRTRGHRIHAPGWHSIERAADYAAVLEEAHVLADPARRREQIASQARKLAADAGLEPLLNLGLIDEVAGLTEWPQAVLGGFDADFLDLPEEVLIASLEQHQKCFALRDSKGRLAAHFIAVANIESRDPQLMSAGFERVIRPRLADARFFRDQDRRSNLASKRDRLDAILFQEQLGSLGDKVRRVENLVQTTSAASGADVDSAVRAAGLSKCDLVTEMVGEFPELQGVIGRYYALDDGESPAVCTAIESHYLPRHGGDELPADPVGQALALADRLDTLLGIFAAGQKPKGGKDPFALRRAALGVIRILADCGTSLRLDELLVAAASAYGERFRIGPELIDEVERFCFERLKPWAAEQGVETNTVYAVDAVHKGSIADFLARCQAVQQFVNDPAMASLIAANKRASNLLKQAEEQEIGEVNRSLLHDDAESELFDAIGQVSSAVDQTLANSDYPGALNALAELGGPLDAFFDQVMVLTDEQNLRRNRLALLGSLRAQFLRIADLARLGR